MALSKNLTRIVKEAAENSAKKSLKEEVGEKLIKRRKALERARKSIVSETKGTKEFIEEQLVGNPSSKGANRKMSSEAVFNKVFKSKESIAQQNEIIANHKLSDSSKRISDENKIREKIINERKQKKYNDIFNSKESVIQQEKIMKDYNNQQKLEDHFYNRKELETKLNDNYDTNMGKYKKNSEEYNKRRSKRLKEKYSGSDVKSKVNETKKNPTGKAAKSVNSNAEESPIKNTLHKAMPIAVGGGVVFGLWNSRGRQSNAQLYGQQPMQGGMY